MKRSIQAELHNTNSNTSDDTEVVLSIIASDGSRTALELDYDAFCAISEYVHDFASYGEGSYSMTLPLLETGENK